MENGINNMKTRRLSWLSVLVLAVPGLMILSSCGSKDSATNNSSKRTLNLLCWAGYEEPQFVGVFEKKYNVKVNYKTFFGGDGMLALLNQSPGQYDVIVVDKDYLGKLYDTKRLRELNPSDFD